MPEKKNTKKVEKKKKIAKKSLGDTTTPSKKKEKINLVETQIALSEQCAKNSEQTAQEKWERIDELLYRLLDVEYEKKEGMPHRLFKRICELCPEISPNTVRTYVYKWRKMHGLIREKKSSN